MLLRHCLQRGVAAWAAPPLAAEADLSAAFQFQLSYPQKVALDALQTGGVGQRFYAPEGASFLDE